MAEKRLYKEYKQLLKAPAHHTNPQILSLGPVDASNDICRWHGYIVKKGIHESPYYYDGKWKLDISVPDTYPADPPKVKFDSATPIFHPNINLNTGEICLDILKRDSWSPAWNITNVVVAILILLDDPEPDSPLNIDSANLFRHDKVAFESVVQYYIWKYNTFYAYEKSQDRTGIKEVNEQSEKGLNAVDIDNNFIEGDDEKSCMNSRKHAHDKLNSVKQGVLSLDSRLEDLNLLGMDRSQSLENAASEEDLSRRSLSPDPKVIQDIGQQVTKQFFDKVNEIGHSYSASNSSDSSIEGGLDTVRQQVSKNVSKQVEELCSQVASVDGSKEVQNEDDNDIYKQEKAKFLKHVDDQVQELRKKQEERQSIPKFN